MKKGIYLGFICMVIGLFASGCNIGTAKEEEGESITIGISVYNEYDTFVAELLDAMTVYAEEMEERYGIPVILDVQNANNKQMTQNDQMNDFLAKDYDVVCINLVDRTDATTIIERGKSSDTPIIFFNRELVQEDLERWDKLYYVGADALESGIIQGEILKEKLDKDFDSVDKNNDGKLQYVMLEGEAGHQDSIVRTMYAVNTVTDAGYKVEKLADEIANWNRDQGKTKMTQWIQEFGPEIEVVFSNNDDMALGARDVLAEAGYYNDASMNPPVVLGIDGTKEGIEAVDNGEFLGTVLNDSTGQAKGILELAYSLAMNEELSPDLELIDGKYIRLPYQKYVKER